MTNVTLSISGREYTVACAAGEEAHVINLGVMIDEKLEELPQTVAHSEVRSLLFAALLLADEIVELRAAIADHSSASGANDPALANRLVAIAERLEMLAVQLDGADEDGAGAEVGSLPVDLDDGPPLYATFPLEPPGASRLTT